MTTTEILERFTINPHKDIAPNLRLLKTIDVHFSTWNGDRCPNCGENNDAVKWVQPLRSIAWTSTYHCQMCRCLIVAYHTDLMGGNPNMTIECYGDH